MSVGGWRFRAKEHYTEEAELIDFVLVVLGRMGEGPSSMMTTKAWVLTRTSSSAGRFHHDDESLGPHAS